ncbi:2-isopropylmalate synthase [Balamuthia mandrillaris]
MSLVPARSCSFVPFRVVGRNNALLFHRRCFFLTPPSPLRSFSFLSTSSSSSSPRHRFIKSHTPLSLSSSFYSTSKEEEEETTPKPGEAFAVARAAAAASSSSSSTDLPPSYEGEDAAADALLNRFESEGVYTGEKNAQGRPHGKGKWTSSGKDPENLLLEEVWEGEWQNGELAQGTVKVPHRFTYSGSLRHNRFEGAGKMTFADGSTYEGEYRNGACEGYGVLRGGARGAGGGTLYEGHWRGGEPFGFGKMTHLAKGVVEEGEWNGWLVKGVRRFADGTYYEGEFGENTHYHGRGKLVLPDGTENEGTWENGQMVRGKVRFSNGTRYEGEVKNGLCHGEGMATFPNGTVFAGEWKDGAFVKGVKTGAQQQEEASKKREDEDERKRRRPPTSWI